jgi:phage regulator Rha-like protein
MLDIHLAELYGVENKYLKRQVRRNIARFPQDFMFELTKEEQGSLRSHFGTLKRGTHTKYLSYAFTQEGIAMLSGILRSERAIQVNVEIMRAFVRMRQLLASHKGLMDKILAMEKKYDEQFKIVFQAIYRLMEEEEKPKRQIGFKNR